MLTSDKAPYIVALLVTILGWHVSQLTEEIRSGHAVGYRITHDPKSNELMAEVRNVSKTKPIIGATFSVICPTRAPCFEKRDPHAADTDWVYGTVDTYPPSEADYLYTVNNPRQISIKTTLAAGSKVTFGGISLPGQGSARFLFKPDADKAIDIYLFESGSIQGFFIDNYFFIVLVSLIFLLIAFAGGAVYALWRRTDDGKADEADAPAPQHIVPLFILPHRRFGSYRAEAKLRRLRLRGPRRG